MRGFFVWGVLFVAGQTLSRKCHLQKQDKTPQYFDLFYKPLVEKLQ
jgi:hypothetical protein